MKRERTSIITAACCIVAGATSLANAGIQNGDFSQLGPNGNGIYVGAIGSAISSAAYWYQFAPEAGGGISTYLVQNGGPNGLTNALLVDTFAPSLSSTYQEGAGVYQTFAPATNAHLDFDLFVLNGTVTGGLYQQTGPFLSFQTYNYTGQWVHVSQVDSAAAIGVAFEDLYNSNAEYYVANVHEWARPVPEPTSVLAMVAGLGGLLIRRKRR